jgi:hypothetical protein
LLRNDFKLASISKLYYLLSFLVNLLVSDIEGYKNYEEKDVHRTLEDLNIKGVTTAIMKGIEKQKLQINKNASQ